MVLSLPEAAAKPPAEAPGAVHQGWWVGQVGRPKELLPHWFLVGKMKTQAGLLLALQEDVAEPLKT